MVDFDTFSFAFWTLLSGTVADSNPRNAKKVNVVVIVIALKSVWFDILIGYKIYKIINKKPRKIIRINGINFINAV